MRKSLALLAAGALSSHAAILPPFITIVTMYTEVGEASPLSEHVQRGGVFLRGPVAVGGVVL